MANKPNRHESKYFNTARLMNEALILLLAQKEYAYITVKDLCQKAGVNRSTFYLHYETMDDLLSETLAYKTEQFRKRFFESETEDSAAEPLRDKMLISPKYLYPYLDFLRENQKLYLSAIRQSTLFSADAYTRNALKEIIYPILAEYNVDPSEQKYMLAYYVSGVHALVLEWVKGGCKEDNEYICNALRKYIFNKNEENA